mgnify:CR=1 FL=1
MAWGFGLQAARQPKAADDREFFPTPPPAGRAGGELIRMLDHRGESCWEPACGAGHLAHGLKDYFGQVFCSDLEPRGAFVPCDFLDFEPPAPPRQLVRNWDWIVTNPPFSRAADFVAAALPRARRGVAMLLPLRFLETDERNRLFARAPPAVVGVFSDRVPMLKGRYDPSASTAAAVAWFIWMTECALADCPLGGAIRENWAMGGFHTRLIPYGTMKRLAHPSDARWVGWW